MHKVAAVIVTYNRKELLVVGLEALRSQTCPLDAIYVIDNASSDGTPEYLMEKGFIEHPLLPADAPIEGINKVSSQRYPDKTIDVHYVRMHKNTGGSGGFHEGVKRAYKRYDWLWLMDDDVKADESCLENLFSKSEIIKAQTREMPAALACARFNLDGEVDGSFREIVQLHAFPVKKNYITNVDLDKVYFKVDGAAFEGLFFNAEVVKSIGFPDRRFFIYSDDVDYCIRLLNLGSIYYIPSAKLARMVKDIPPARGKQSWKYYYAVRNMFYLDLKYAKTYIKLVRIPYGLIRWIAGRIYNWDIRGIGTVFKCFYHAIRMYREDYNYFA